MAISKQDILRIASLARLDVQDSEIEALSKQLSGIVALVDQLASVDTRGVEPMVHAFELENALEEDRVRPSLPREDALKNAPSHDGECFRVPPVLG